MSVGAPPFSLTPLLELVIELGPLHSLGAGAAGERRFAEIKGGHISGAGITATLDYGRDDQFLRADGTLEIDATYMFRTASGARLKVVNQGMRHGPPDVLARLGAGEAVPRDSYFFATTIRFETSDADLDHFNRVIAVAQASRRGGEVIFDIWQIG